MPTPTSEIMTKICSYAQKSAAAFVCSLADSYRCFFEKLGEIGFVVETEFQGDLMYLLTLDQKQFLCPGNFEQFYSFEKRDSLLGMVETGQIRRT